MDSGSIEEKRYKDGSIIYTLCNVYYVIYKYTFSYVLFSFSGKIFSDYPRKNISAVDSGVRVSSTW